MTEQDEQWNRPARRAARYLSPEEEHAAQCFVGRVRREVPARLVQASLFGSKARRQARPDSDIDILLVFHWLPWDREPFATYAEEIADEVARTMDVPVTAWSVSLIDLKRGNRTPMLVDALADSVPLWFERFPLRPVRFTPDDALRCVDALLTRVSEGSAEFADHLARGGVEQAVQRVRDDVVRLCTAGLLLRGETRPRRGDAVRRYAERLGARSPVVCRQKRVLAWAANSYGAEGRDDQSAVTLPPGGTMAAARAVDELWEEILATARRLALRAG